MENFIAATIAAAAATAAFSLDRSHATATLTAASHEEHRCERSIDDIIFSVLLKIADFDSFGQNLRGRTFGQIGRSNLCILKFAVHSRVD